MNRFLLVFVLLLIQQYAIAQDVKGIETDKNSNSQLRTKSMQRQQSSNFFTDNDINIDKNLSNNYPIKAHYILHFHTRGMDSNYYKKAAAHFERYDSYRFMNERRIIDFVGGEVSIELFSAVELKDSYGKKISPLTIENKNKCINIKFDINNGYIKELFQEP